VSFWGDGERLQRKQAARLARQRRVAAKKRAAELEAQLRAMKRRVRSE
jgi:hypothetical protein